MIKEWNIIQLSGYSCRCKKEQPDVRVGLFFFNKYYFKQVLAYLEAFFFNSAFFNVSAPT